MKLKIFLCNEVVRDLDFASQCRLARTLGYDGLEIAPFTLADDLGNLKAADVAEFRKIAEAEGTEISGLHWLLAAPSGLSITSGVSGVAEKTRGFGKKLVELCVDLGGKYLVHGSPAQRTLKKSDEADGRMNATKYFADIGDHALKHDVKYYIEPLSRHDTKYITRLEEALELITEVDCPALGTMVDCYATATNGEDIVTVLNQWIPKGVIEHVHFNDANRQGPGQGSIKFGPIIDLLYDLGYTGTSAVEPFDYVPNGTACAARAIGYLRGLAESGH